MSFNSPNETGNKNSEIPGQRLMNFFNAVDEVFFCFDSINSKVVGISNGCFKLSGYTPEDFQVNGNLLFELAHPDDRHIIINDNILLNSGEKVNSKHRIIHKNSSVRWIERKILPYLDETGKLIKVEGILRDITAYKKLEKKQRQNEAWYRQLFEIAQEGIWTIDEHNKTNFVNQKMADILGYTPEEMIGKEPQFFFDEKDKKNAVERIERRRVGAKENIDLKYIKKGGDEVWANITANPIFSASGKYKGSMAMVTDITQRKLAEEAIKKSEANLRAIFDNTDSSYLLISNELKIVSFNALAQKYSIAQNKKELETDKHISEYFTGQRWPQIKEIIEKVAAGQNITYELNYADEEGTINWYNVRWLNIRNSDNKSWGFILANKEITEAKIAAIEREKITSELIQHNKHLVQFTYIISHNLRAPVANIIGLSEMLKEHDMDQASKTEVIERISLSTKNIDAVIQDLNHILQTRELLNEKKQLVNFNEIVDAIKTSINNKVVSENVQFNCDFSGAETIFSIPGYLYSILYNLTSNSIKYRRPGIDPVISIKSYKINDKVELIFKDNGKGIDLEKNASQMFGLYKRFDTSAEGKGMGLFMVKTQVEALGGTIKVNSELGKGTEFIIQL